MAALIDSVLAAAASDGFWTLVIAGLLAGLVRGFTGFGTAMVYLPLAGLVLPPTQAIVSLLVIDIIGPLPAVPRALREGHVKDVFRLSIGVLLGAPIGLSILLVLDPAMFRIIVSTVALLLLVILVAGIRYRGPVTKPLIYGTGVSAGVLYGISGLPGPPVILFYMARPLPVAVIRASVLLFLVLADAWLFGLYWLRGLLEPGALLLGFCVTPFYLGAVVVGAWLFHPDYARVYRGVAYAVIAGAALAGLPIWGL